MGAVRDADWSDPERARAAVVETMTRFLPSEELRFLMELSVDPLAEQLGLSPAARSGP